MSEGRDDERRDPWADTVDDAARARGWSEEQREAEMQRMADIYERDDVDVGLDDPDVKRRFEEADWRLESGRRVDELEARDEEVLARQVAMAERHLELRQRLVREARQRGDLDRLAQLLRGRIEALGEILELIEKQEPDEDDPPA